MGRVGDNRFSGAREGATLTIKIKVSSFAVEAVQTEVPKLVIDKVASRIFAKDFSLWGKDAEAESSIRLGWVDAAANSSKLVPELLKLRDELREKGISRIVLCGMGGSSLAPEVFAGTSGVDLVVLDSTDPSQVIDAVNTNLNKTAVVVSSKSGSTVETDSQKRTFEAAFTTAGIEKTERIIIVTDPGSPMEQKAIADGYRVFQADPTVGGRYSALTAFGIVPSVLAGVDVEPLLADATAAAVQLSHDSENNPGLILGAILGRSKGALGYRDKIGFVPDGTQIAGFGDWLEQLIAESTGKIDRGILPVVLDKSSFEVNAGQDDVVLIGLSADADNSDYSIAVSGSLGEQLMLWEVATVVASRLIGINPFDQPDVESAKVAARAMLESPAESGSYLFKTEGISVNAENLPIDSRSSLPTALEALLASATEDSYFSIQAYLNRNRYPEALRLRNLIASKTGRPVTFGWGPRFLHSTGQYHKGGPKQGIFLQLTSNESEDLQVEGREFTFKELITSQADGDARVLAATGRPVVSLRMDDPAEGIKSLVELLS